MPDLSAFQRTSLHLYNDMFVSRLQSEIKECVGRDKPPVRLAQSIHQHLKRSFILPILAKIFSAMDVDKNI